MTYKQILKLLSQYSDCGREWWVTKFISTKEKPNDILWIDDINYSLDETTCGYNSKNEEITIKDDETELCVTFLGVIRIDTIEELKKAWIKRISIYENLKKNNNLTPKVTPPFTTFIGN